jgi:hypothetical protein
MSVYWYMLRPYDHCQVCINKWMQQRSLLKGVVRWTHCQMFALQLSNFRLTFIYLLTLFTWPEPIIFNFVCGISKYINVRPKSLSCNANTWKWIHRTTPSIIAFRCLWLFIRTRVAVVVGPKQVACEWFHECIVVLIHSYMPQSVIYWTAAS